MGDEAIAECVTDVFTTFTIDFFCDLLLNRRTATWNRFVVIIWNQSVTEKKLFFISKFFNITRPLLSLVNKKKAIWRDVLSLQNEQSHWLLCVYKNHATVTWIERSLTVKWIENLQRRQNWTVKSTNVKENAGVNSDFVIRAALWAKKLDVPLNSAGVGEISLDWKAPGTCGARKAIYS